MLQILKKLYNKLRKDEEKPILLSDITVFDFKNCYNGNLSCINNDVKKWSAIDELYQNAINADGVNIALEISIQIALKENTVIILDNYLFMLRNAFQSYLNALVVTDNGADKDKYYLEIIEYCAEELIKHGIKYKKEANLITEHNRCVKLVRNKRNDIQVDINDLKDTTKGGITFDDLIAIVGKFSGGGLIRQKTTTMDEFVSFYNLMVNHGS